MKSINYLHLWSSKEQKKKKVQSHWLLKDVGKKEKGIL